MPSSRLVSKTAAPSPDDPSLDLEAMLQGLTVAPTSSQPTSSKSRLSKLQSVFQKTKVAKVGDNQRTYVEGMAPESQFSKLNKTQLGKETFEKTIGASRMTLVASGYNHPTQLREQTLAAFLGNNERTFVEGMAPRTQFRDLNQSQFKNEGFEKTIGASKMTIAASGYNDPTQLRQQTSAALLGNNERTYVEGMLSRTGFSEANKTFFAGAGGDNTVDVTGMTLVPSKYNDPTQMRDQTEHAALGDNQRTLVEGMAHGSEFARLNRTMLTKAHAMNDPTPMMTIIPTIRETTLRKNQTEAARIGNNARTFHEGMASQSEYNKLNKTQLGDSGGTKSTAKAGQNPKAGQTSNAIVSFVPPVSVAPPGLKSQHTTQTDRNMASKQTAINSMVGSQHTKQETWAQKQLKAMLACPEGFDWSRKTDKGYNCNGGTHFISDEQLAEGKGGLYFVLDREDPTYVAGPYYPFQDDPKNFQYQGKLPKMPPWAPSYLYPDGVGHFDRDGNPGGKPSVSSKDIPLMDGRDLAFLFKARGITLDQDLATADEEELKVARRVMISYCNEQGPKSGTSLLTSKH